MASFGMDMGGISSGDTEVEDGRELKHIASVLENRVENIILDNLIAWKRDVGDSQKRTEELYKRIDKILGEAQESTVPAASTFTYERQIEDLSTEFDKDFCDTMEIDGAFITDDRNVMVQEMQGIIRGTTPKTLKVDEDYVSIVKTMQERFKKNLKIMRVLNKDNKKLDDLYNDALRDKNEYSIRMETMKALIKDVSTINALVSKGLTTAAKSTRNELKAIKAQLIKLQTHIEKMEEKRRERAENIQYKLSVFTNEVDQISSMAQEEINLVSQFISSLNLNRFNRQQYAQGINDRILKKQQLLASIVTEYQKLVDASKERYESQRAQYTVQLYELRAQQPSPSQQPPPSQQPSTSSQQPSSPPSIEHQRRQQMINTLDSNQKKQNAKRYKAVVQAVNESNAAFDRYADLAKSEWNSINSVKCNQSPSEPTIYKIDDIVRMAEIYKPMNKESLVYLRDDLKMKWTNIVSATFTDTKQVTINGVTETIKSLRHTLFTHVIPCIEMLYTDWDAMNGIHILLKSETQTSVDTLKDKPRTRKKLDAR